MGQGRTTPGRQGHDGCRASVNMNYGDNQLSRNVLVDWSPAPAGKRRVDRTIQRDRYRANIMIHCIYINLPIYTATYICHIRSHRVVLRCLAFELCQPSRTMCFVEYGCMQRSSFCRAARYPDSRTRSGGRPHEKSGFIPQTDAFSLVERNFFLRRVYEQQPMLF